MKKTEVLKAGIEHCRKNISEMEFALQELRESRNNESKSSMGDKYETGRSMVQMEMDRLSGQLEMQKSNLNAIKQIHRLKEMDHVDYGALIKTDKALYLISVALGKLSLSGQDIFCISPASPLAKAMFELHVNDTFSFRDQHHRILSIS